MKNSIRYVMLDAMPIEYAMVWFRRRPSGAMHMYDMDTAVMNMPGMRETK